MLSLSTTHATWNLIATFPQGKVVSMYFFDEQHGFVGLDGFTQDNTGNHLLRTTDGGATWTESTLPFYTKFLSFEPWIGDIWFYNNTEGWATYVYGNGTCSLIHTIDGGMNWENTSLVTHLGAYAVRQTSEAVSVTCSDAIYVSTDDGVTFTQANAAGNAGIDFVDDLHGAVAGINSGFALTSDGGVTWQYDDNYINNEGWGLYGMKGTPNFFAVPEDLNFVRGSLVYESSDYGQSWARVAGLYFKPSGEIKGYGQTMYIQASTGDFWGTEHGLFRSTDLGRLWVNIGGPTSYWDGRIAVTGCGNVVYAADDSGCLYKSIDGGDGQITGGSTVMGEVQFAPKLTPDPISPSDTLRVAILPDTSIQDVNLQSISGVLEYYDDAFDLISITGASGLTFTHGGAERFGKTAHIRFSCTNVSGITLDPQTPLFTASLKTMLSDSLNIPFVIDSLLLNVNDPNYQLCVLNATTAETISHAHIPQVCGDPTIRQALQDKPLLGVTSIYPNPVTSANNYIAALELTSTQDGTAEITLSNALGTMLKTETMALKGGSNYPFSFDLSRLAAGTYLYAINFTSNTAQANVHGSLMLIK
jgi:photosystem II stability/assembly factor-like uncharacterized protein